jgi:hypothetical protein
MATYLQGVTPYIPQIQPFQEDFNFYGNVLQQRQTAYDSNFKALNDVYGQYFYADMLREDNLERKAELIKTIDTNLRKASGTDLSLQQNVQAAKQIFKPFYEDKALMKDIAFTESYKNQLSKAESLKNCVGSDCPEGYWDGGVRLLHYQAEDFRKASAEKALNFQNPSYTSYVNVMKEANAAVKAAGFKITYEGSNGKYIVKTENGDQAIAPLNDFLLQNFGNDPRFIDFYKAQADLTLRENPEAAIDIYEQQMLRRQAKSPEEYKRLVQEKAQEKALTRSKTYINETAQETRKISKDAEMFAYSWDEYAKASGGLLAPDAKLAEEAKNEAQVTKQTYEQVAALADSVNGVKYYDANGQRVSDETLKQTVASALMYSDIANTATTIARATASQTVKGPDPYAIAKYKNDLSIQNYTQKKIIDIASTINPETGGLIDTQSNRNKWEDQYNKSKADRNITHSPKEKEDLYQNWLQEQGQERLQSLDALRNMRSGNAGGVTQKKADAVNKVLQESPNPSDEIKPRSTSVNVNPTPSTTQKDEKQKPFEIPSAVNNFISNVTGTKFKAEYGDAEDGKAIFGLTQGAQALENEELDENEFGINDSKSLFNHAQNGNMEAFNSFKELASGTSKTYNAQSLIPTFKNKLTSSDFQNTAKLIYTDIKNAFKEVEFPENIDDTAINEITQKLTEANEADPIKLFKAFTSSSRALAEEQAVIKEIETEFKKTSNPIKGIGVVKEDIAKAFNTYNLAKEVKLKALGIDYDQNKVALETIIAQDRDLQKRKDDYIKENTMAIDQMVKKNLPGLQSEVEYGLTRSFGHFAMYKYGWNPKENNGYGGISDNSYIFNKVLQNDAELVQKAIGSKLPERKEQYEAPSYDNLKSFITKLNQNGITLDNNSLKSLVLNFTSGFNTSNINDVKIKENNLIINNQAVIPLSSVIIPNQNLLLDFIPSEKNQKSVIINTFKTLVATGSKGNVPGKASLFEGATNSDWDQTSPTMHINLPANTLENDKTVYDFIYKGISQVVGDFKQSLKNFAGTDIARVTTESGEPVDQNQATILQSLFKQNWSKETEQSKIPELDIYIQPLSEHGLNISKVTVSVLGGAEGLKDKLGATTNEAVSKKSIKDAKNPLTYIPETFVLYVDSDKIEEYGLVQRNIAWGTIKAGQKFGEENDPAYIEILKETPDRIEYKINLRTFNPDAGENGQYENQSWTEEVGSGTKENIHYYLMNKLIMNNHMVNEYNKSHKQ